MSTEVVETGTNEVAEYDETVLGAASDITADDIQIGRISVMQSMSVLVQEDEAKKGQIINLDTGDVLGDTETPAEFIILKAHKYWIEKEGDDFVARYPAVSPDEKPWTEGSITRTYHHAFYVLLPEEIKDGVEVPYEIAFRSTDLASAKKVSKFLLAMGRKKIPSWGKVFQVTTKEKSKDKYKWFGTEVSLGEDTTAAQKQKAYEWYMQLNTMKVREAAPEQTSSKVAHQDEY